MAYEFLFANNATTTLAESVSATATVLNVSSGDGALFPSPASGQAFAVTLVDAATGLTNEICYCTSRSGDALTVVRGQEGKNALAWSAGDTCANYITADVMESWLQESDLDGYLTETVGDGRYVKQYTDDETYDVSQVGINKNTGDFVAYSEGTWQSYQPAGDYATKSQVLAYLLAGTGLGKSQANPGYQILPGGTIIQYGSSTSGANGGTTITFPITFPNACISVNLTESNASSTWPGDGSSGTPTLHGVSNGASTQSFGAYSMRWQNSNWGGSQGLGFMWIAVGY